MWRWTQVHHTDLLIAVYNSASLSQRLSRREAVADHMRERSRRRKTVGILLREMVSLAELLTTHKIGGA